LHSRFGPFTICRSNAGEVPLAREQRKLAAILAGDVVSYSRLMGRDKSCTLARLREHCKECLGRHLRFGARLVKSNGDTP
jgi:class 3 adenylate cyclase